MEDISKLNGRPKSKLSLDQLSKNNASYLQSTFKFSKHFHIISSGSPNDPEPLLTDMELLISLYR